MIEKNKKHIGCKFFHTDNYMVSYVRNTTEGITIATNVIPLESGDEVVISSLEHRFADNSWEYICEKRHAKLIKVKILPDDSSDEILRKFKEATSEQTKVIFCSHVDRNFEIQFPINRLSALVNEKNAYMIIDGAQAVGLIDVNLDKLDS